MLANMAEEDAFSPEQESRLRQLIAEGAPKPSPRPAGRRSGGGLLEDEGQQSDWQRQRDTRAATEEELARIVDRRLDELAKDAEFEDMKAELEALRAEKAKGSKPRVPRSVEKPPEVFSKLRKFMWGSEPERAS